MQHTDLARLVTTILPASLINSLGRELGVVTRQRVVWLAPLVWGLVLGTLTAPSCSLAHFWRLYCTHMGTRLARSSFYDRLTPQLTALFDALLQRALRANRRALSHWLIGYTDLDDVVAVDSSVVPLRDDLHGIFEACKTAAAALKIHAVVSVLDFRPHHVRLSSQTEHDKLGLSRVRQWCRGKLVLMDLGYYSFESFAMIDTCGGFFISRAKKGAACRIVRDYTYGSGAFTSLAGLKLKDALKRITRQVLDADVELVFKQGGTRCTRVMRVVGVWNEQEGRYHVYLTNLERREYPADEIAQLYRMRWGIELMWKHLKSDGHLEVQTSTKDHIVRMRIDCVLLAYCITGRLCAQIQRRCPERPYPVSRGMRALGVLVPRLIDELCEPWAKPRSLMDLFEQMTRDPNEYRERAYDPLLRTSELRDTS